MSTQIIEEWLTIPEVAEFFEISEKQARRIIKKLVLTNNPDAKQEKIEGHFGTPDGQILESYVLLIRSKKCYQLWTEKPNLLELVRKFEVRVGKQIKVSTQTEEATPQVSTQEDKLWVDKNYFEILKEDRVERKDWQNRFLEKDRQFLEKDKELTQEKNYFKGLVEKIIMDARTTKQMLRAQINYLQKQLHAPKEPKETKFEEGSFKEESKPVEEIKKE
jgi:hypothetical protein